MRKRRHLYKVIAYMLILAFCFNDMQMPAKAMTRKEEVQQEVAELSGYEAGEQDGYSLNRREITLDAEASFQLQLLDDEGIAQTGVEWYCKVLYPEGFYTADETQDAYAKGNIGFLLNNQGLVTAKTINTEMVVYAVYQDGIYACVVKVCNEISTHEKIAYEKVNEVIDTYHFAQLESDAEKVLAVHDYLARTITYEYEHTDKLYQALIEGRAVCYGYAQSFKAFMNKLNIPCEVVQGEIISTGGRHAWDIVQLDDGWYYVDVTWDDKINADPIYQYSFVDKEQLGKTHRFLYEETRPMGQKYKFFPYRQNNMLADNEEQLEQVLMAQIQAKKGSSSVMVECIIPDTLRGKIDTVLKKNLGNGISVIKSQNKTEVSLGDGYYQVFYNVNGISTEVTKNVTWESIVTANTSQGEWLAYNLTFSEAIDGLKRENILVEGAEIVSLTQTGEKTYRLALQNVLQSEAKPLTISVAKVGYGITPASKEVSFSLAKENTPETIFTPIDDLTGWLSNVEPGMYYTTQDGTWHEIVSKEPVKVTLNMSYSILIYKKGTNGKLSSDMQKMGIDKSRSPYNLKTHACTNKTAPNGKITGVSRHMEYRKQGDTEWIPCSGNEINGLSAGYYEIRYKAERDLLASGATVEIVEEEIAITPETTKEPEPIEEVKPTEESKPTQEVKPIETVEPVKSVEPTKTDEPIKPAEPIKTVEPQKTVMPTKPAEATKTVEPQKTVMPIKSEEPVKTVEPQKTVMPTKPAEATKTDEPIKPAEPIKTVEPQKTVGPVKPSEPTKTEEPTKPTEPTKTDEPIKSAEPIETVEPTNTKGPTTLPTQTVTMSPFPTSTSSPQQISMVVTTAKPVTVGTIAPNVTEQPVAGPTPTVTPKFTIPMVKVVKVQKTKGNCVKITIKRVAKVSGYQLQYGVGAKYKNRKTKYFKSASITVKKLKKNTQYYFRIRAYKRIGNKKIYGKWSTKSLVCQ